MSCMISFDDPDSRDELVRPIRLMNDELIDYNNGLMADSFQIRQTLNTVFQEDEECLFCKSKQEGTKLHFYGSMGYISTMLIDSLNEGVENELLSGYSLKVFEHLGEVVFKLTLDYYDCLEWLKLQTKEAIEIHREYIKDYGDVCMPGGMSIFPALKHYMW